MELCKFCNELPAMEGHECCEACEEHLYQQQLMQEEYMKEMCEKAVENPYFD